VGTGAASASASAVSGAGVITHVGTGAAAASAAAVSGAGTYSGASACLTLTTVITGTTTVQDLFEAMIDMVAAYTTARAAKLDNLDATVSSRLASTGYTAPDNASIALIKTNTDNLDARNMGSLLVRNPFGASEVLGTQEPKKP
jgi:hypothetical protein